MEEPKVQVEFDDDVPIDEILRAYREQFPDAEDIWIEYRHDANQSEKGDIFPAPEIESPPSNNSRHISNMTTREEEYTFPEETDLWKIIGALLMTQEQWDDDNFRRREKWIIDQGSLGGIYQVVGDCILEKAFTKMDMVIYVLEEDPQKCDICGCLDPWDSLGPYQITTDLDDDFPVFTSCDDPRCILQITNDALLMYMEMYPTEHQETIGELMHFLELDVRETK
jgi:hypothetical protein